MVFKVRKIDSIASFVRALTADRKDIHDPCWFRGQSQASWPLLPGYLRIKDAPSETNVLNEFRQSAAMLTDRIPNESFDWLMLMQHYGVPTRLLDWTENPMVALYFALSGRESHKGKDAALWLLRPVQLNQHANIYDGDNKNYIPSFADDEPSPYTIEYMRKDVNTQLMPIAAISVRNNARIQAQSGVFTIHHKKKVELESIGDGSHVTKYVIPAAKKDQLAAQLETLGLNRFHIFPELETIGGIIKEKYK